MSMRPESYQPILCPSIREPRMSNLGLFKQSWNQSSPMSRHREQNASKRLTLIKLTWDEKLQVPNPSNSDCSEQYRLNACGMWVNRSEIIRARLERYTSEENMKDGGTAIPTSIQMEQEKRKGLWRWTLLFAMWISHVSNFLWNLSFIPSLLSVMPLAAFCSYKFYLSGWNYLIPTLTHYYRWDVLLALLWERFMSWTLT